jgi:hypothetical protein
MVSDCSHAHALLGLVVYAPPVSALARCEYPGEFPIVCAPPGAAWKHLHPCVAPTPIRDHKCLYLGTSPLSSASGSNNPIDESCLRHPELDQVRSRFTLVSSIEMAYFGVFVCSHHNEGVHLLIWHGRSLLHRSNPSATSIMLATSDLGKLVVAKADLKTRPDAAVATADRWIIIAPSAKRQYSKPRPRTLLS